MTPIPNGSTPSAEAQGRSDDQPTDALSSGAATRKDAGTTAPVATSLPHDGTIEQTTGAAVGGVSANIPDDVMQAAWSLLPWQELTVTMGERERLAEVIARAIVSAKAEQREADARIAERDGSSHSATFSQQTAEWHRDTALQVRTADRIANRIRKGA